MISFGPTEEQELAREAMREFGEQVLRTAARDADEAESLPEGLLDQVHELGLLATQIPEAYGGGGEERSPLTHVANIRKPLLTISMLCDKCVIIDDVPMRSIRFWSSERAFR